MASHRSSDQDPDDARRYDDLPFKDSIYYPRFYPDWQYDPYRLSVAAGSALDAEKVRSLQPVAFPVAYNNPGFYGTRKDSLTSGDSSDDFRNSVNRRRCYVVIFVASVVFLLAAAIGVGLYFAVYDRPDSMRTVTTTTPRPETVSSYEATLRMNQVYTAELDDPTSSTYISLKNDVETLVNSNMQSSDLDSAFIDAVVTGFRRGSIEAILKLDFSSSQVVIGNQERSLSKVIVQDQLRSQLGRSSTLVDTLGVLADNTVVQDHQGTGSADLGESCIRVADCSDTNTGCSGSPPVCSCVDGYYDSNGEGQTGGTCVPKVAYNSSMCSASSQCATSGAVCLNNLCVCDPTEHFFKNGACVNKISINQPGCEKTSECATTGAVCTMNTCVCPNTLYYNGQQCVEKIGINSAGCSMDFHCATPGAVCTNSICVCSPEYYFFDGQTCVEKRLIGQSCSQSEECFSDMAVCLNNVCLCPSGSYYENDGCMPTKANGEDCTSDQECSVSGSVCDNISGTCSCTSSTYLSGTSCLSKKDNGEACSSADECLVSDSICTAGTCSCSSSSYLQGTSCLNKKAIGEACSIASECLVSDAVCTAGVCDCPSYMYPEGMTCLPKRPNGLPCAMDKECLYTNAVCDSGTCGCPGNTYLDGSVCMEKQLNGESCSSVAECLVTGAICNGGTCECPDTLYLQGTSCMDKKMNGEMCSSSMECLVTNSFCDSVSGTCSCAAAMYLDGLECRSKKGQGESCSSAMECLVTDAVCDGGQCACSATTYLQGMACLNKKAYGESCTSAVECLVSGSVCDGGQCACLSTMYLQGMTCLNKKGQGESCSSATECLVTDSICDGGQCACPSTMYLQGMTCLNKKGHGESCSSSMECLITDSICDGGQCACPSTMYLQGMTCLNKKANGELCSSTMECLVTDSMCNGGRCSCSANMYLDGTTCLNKKGYNEVCIRDVECMGRDLVCRSSMCQCTPDKMYDGMMCVATTPKPTTSAPTTEQPTTEKPTTAQPTTKEPTTAQPTTKEPTTAQPTTKDQTTAQPTTKEPTTAQPTTKEPTTAQPTTKEPTTAQPTTKEPTTAQPTTKEPTTAQPTTKEPTTAQPTTKEPTTAQPTTKEPTTAQPTTKEPTTAQPTTQEPTTAQPTTKEPTTAQPTTKEPTTAQPTTKEPTTPKTTTKEPTTPQPTTKGPTTAQPTTKEPTTTQPTTKEPTTTQPTTKEPTTPQPTTKEPTTPQPTTKEPTTPQPTTKEPTTPQPTTKEPTTQQPATQEPTTAQPTTKEPTTQQPTTQQPTTQQPTTQQPTTQQPTTRQTTGMTTRTPTTRRTTTEPLTTTSFTPPTTVVPDEVPIIQLNGTVTSSVPYDPQLADPSSALYQNYSAGFEKAIEDGLRANGQEGDVTNITFSEGSIRTDYILVVPVAAVEVPETRQDLVDLSTKVEEMVLPVVEQVFTEIVNDSSAPDFMKAINVTTAKQIDVIPDPPCRNGLTMLDFAEEKVCGDIVSYFVNNSTDDTCSTYLALLDCVSLMYSYEDETCSWNTMRANFEQKAMRALGLQDKDVETCVKGNYYIFEPMAPIQSDQPCMDVNLMYSTARFECQDVVKYMMANNQDSCGGGKLLTGCIKSKLEAHYTNCTVDPTMKDYGLSMIVDHQMELFHTKEMYLETCEYCAAANLEAIMFTQCFLPTYFMTVGSWEGADCNLLQSMILCVEAHTSLWTTAECGLMDIMAALKANQDRFYQYLADVPAFQNGGFAQCLDQPIQGLGPPLSGDMCENHNYIAYVFVYECTDWRRIAEGDVRDQCSEHLIATQCVVRHFSEVVGVQCDYEAINTAIWERNNLFNIIDMLIATEFPGTECAEHFQTPAGKCQQIFIRDYASIIQSCVPVMEKNLEQKLMTIPDVSCGVFYESSRCAMRDLISVTAPTCQLSDIEPAVRTGFFIEYAQLSNCPSQGSSSYEREAICNSGLSMGAYFLTSCGGLLMESEEKSCSIANQFSQCTQELGRQPDANVGVCDKPTIAQAFRQLERTLTIHFGIDEQCFETNEGQCVVEQLDTCTGVVEGERSCLLDKECGNMEKCCSDGCYTECSNLIEDTNPKNGTCPPLDPDIVCDDEVINTCYIDAHCNGDDKCCYDGCKAYCRSEGRIYTKDDCRSVETIQTAVVSCTQQLTLDFDSCRSFYRLVTCVQSRLDLLSSGVECQYETTHEDVGNQVQYLYGTYTQCRVYHAWLTVTETECQDPDIRDLDSEAGGNYISAISPLLQKVLGTDFDVYAINFAGGDTCGNVIIETQMYAVSTTEKLRAAVQERINNLRDIGELEKNVFVIVIIYEYADFNRCTDPPSLIYSMSNCLPQFDDSTYIYESWETCKPVQDLTMCTAEKLRSVCDYYELKFELYVNQRDDVLKELQQQDGTQKLTEVIKRYDLDTCETRGDVYPCWDDLTITSSVSTCSVDADWSGFAVNDMANDNYGITRQNCGEIYDLVSCVTEELRSLGADCDVDQTYIGTKVYQYVRDNVPDGTLLPAESSYLDILCADNVPVCSAAYISRAYEYNCYVPYIHNNLTPIGSATEDCSSSEAKEAFQELVTCLRFSALALGSNDCTVAEIVNVIDNDPLKLGLFTTDTDLQTCVGAIASELDAALMSKDMVCQSPTGLGYFAEKCALQGECPLDLAALPNNANLKCSMYFWLSSCVEQFSEYMTFNCSLQDVLAADMTGTTLELDANTLGQCQNIGNDEYMKCQYPAMMKIAQFEPCYNPILQLAPNSGDTCNTYYNSVYCMRQTLLAMEDVQCDPVGLEDTVAALMIDFLELQSHASAQASCSPLPTMNYRTMFTACTADTCEDALGNIQLLLGSASACDVNLFTIQRDLEDYTCRTAIEKFGCFTEELNRGRPLLYACQPSDIIDVLMGQFGDEADSINLSFDIETCSEWDITVTYYNKFCINSEVPPTFISDFRNNKLPVLMRGLEYKYETASCGSVIFDIAGYSDLLEADLQQKLNRVIYSDPAFTGETLDVKVKKIELGPQWCDDMSVLTLLGTECVKGGMYNYLDWQTCSPVYGLMECIAEKVYKLGKKECNGEALVKTLFGNATRNEQFVTDLTHHLHDNRTMSYKEELWLEAIDRFSLEKCPNGEEEMSPCDDEEKMAEIYNTCKIHTINPIIVDMNNDTFGITPENCREYSYLVDCAWKEMSKLRAQCWDILPQFMFDKLKEEFNITVKDFPEKYTEFCTEHQPVCTTTSIMEAKKKCPWNDDRYSKPLDCKSETDIAMATDFLTCVRLMALSKNEENCTASRIKEIIAEDYFKLGLINRTSNIDMCMPDDVVSEILPIRESVCFSGSVISLYQPHCVPFSMRNMSCPVDAGHVIDQGAEGVGCMLYVSQMRCIQMKLMNLSFSCSIDQLTSSPLQESSPLYLPSYRSEQCLAVFTAPAYVRCEAGLAVDPETYMCTTAFIEYMNMSRNSTQDKQCMLYQESLSCYDRLANKKNLSCSHNQLHFYQLGAIDLALYVNRPASQCNAPLQPSGLDSCPGTIPEGDLCTRTERLRNLVFGVCLGGLDQMTSSELAGDQMKCRLYDTMLNCAVNVTHTFGNPCTVEQVERAVLEGNMSAIIPGLDPELCPVKPVRWHVELLFANETFTGGMADSTSDDFYNFVYRKYMHLMSVMFDQFERYEVVSLRSEDELTLTVYVWSVETPYNMMYRNLVKEFAPDMRNIKIGSVYEDQDVTGQCPPVPEGSVGICVEECSSDSDCYPGSLCCSNGCGHTCQRSYTPDLKCSPAFIEKAKYDGCIHSYGEMLRADNDTEQCRHFTGFLTCIKFHALVNEERCSVDDLVTMIRNETSISFPSTCQYSDLKEQFPATREDVCTNTWIHHSIWEYVCLTFDLSEIRDPDNRCRTEISRRGCVLRTLQLANEGCSMDNVVRISQQPEFREGILDSVEPDCESRLPGDTACMKLFFMEESQDSTETCFLPLYNLQRLAMLKSADEVNKIMTSNGQRSLKCSLFEETALCYLNILPSRLYSNNGVELNCTALDIAPALSAATEINYDIQLQYLPTNTPAQQIFFDKCEGNLTSDRPVKECPSPSTVVDLVVGQCGAIVIGGLYSEGKPVNDTSCRMYDAFMECVHGLYLPNSELCPDDHIWMSLREYSWYIREQMAGLDPEQCQVDAACSDMDRIKRDYLPKCDQILEQLKTTTGDSPRCRLMKELFPCIVDNMAADNLKCWGEQLKREMLQGEILKDWGIGLDWPYYDVCEVDRCSAAFIERAIYEDCAASYYYMMSSMEDTQRCRRYLEFMGCIKYNALMNDDSCPVREIENLIRDSTSIGSSATYKDHLSQCQYPDLEDQLPKSKAEICNNTLIHHSIWEYACLPYNLSVVRDPDNRCSAEISRRGCVYGILREANKDCTMDNVVEVSQRPELRDSLLDSVEPDCDSKTPVCVKTFLEEAEAAGSGCFTPLFYLQSLTLYKSADEVNRMRSSDNNSSLKCSLFESVLQCYLSNGERNQNSIASYYNCTAADLAPGVTAATEIYYDILAPGLPPNTSLPQIQVDECEETLSTVEPIRGCPSLSYVADLVVGSCSARVVGGLQSFGLTSDNGTCLMYDSFVECVNQVYLPNGVLCPYGYVWKALREYSPYVRQQMAGFDPEQCRVEKTCYDMDLIKSMYLPECYHIFRDLTLTEGDQEKCRLFDEFVDCIIDTMAGDNLICNHDNLKRHMIDKNILSDWSEGFYWNYYDNCEETDKPGYCPVKLDREYLVGVCAPQCQYDSDCDNRQKCCHVGCGLACFDPLGYNPYQMAIPVRLRASTLSLSSIYLQWYDPSLDDDQIILDGRFYTVQYYNYEEGVITYINVTDHWVTIDGLKADTEYYFYVKSMNPPYLSRWSEEATNRTAGQPAKTSCEDDGYVLQVTTESCSQELESVQMYNTSSPDNCIAFVQLYQCIQKNMQRMWHYCDMDQLLSILERHSYLFPGLDISHCNGLVCTPLFLERARTGGKCSESLTQISEARSELENCRHYENLLGCIRYHSLINEEACNLTGDIETWIQDIVGSVTYCQACDYKWRVENNQGQLEAEVMIDLHADKGDATITMRANNFDPSSQWLAIGFSNNRFMAGSDIYTVQMMDNGEWMVRDRFADGRAKPLPDDMEAAYLVYGYMENDTAIIRFLRPIDSGDLDRDLTLDTERYLQFARGPLGSNGDISYHSFRKTSDQMYNFYCDPYSNFENRLPSTKEQICSNPAVHRYMLEYKCLWYNINATSDQSDRCRLELSLRGCVLGPLLEADIGCRLDDVNQMFQLPAVREGLLDSVRPRCEAYLTNDTECMKNFYTDLALKSEHCIDGLRRLQDYSYAPNFDINKIMSVTGERTLKCSFFEETLMCHMHAVQNGTLIDGEESICTAYDYAPALTAIMHSYFVIYRAGDVGFNVSSCKGNLTEPTRDCPAPSRVVDLVMGNCGLQILLYQNLDPCSMLDFFMECAGLINITNRELCPDDYMWASIVQYSDLISLQYAGFHPQKCRASQFCNSIDRIREEFEPYCLNEQRKVLNNLYNTRSCQYFLQFVDCIHEKMEAQQISCNYLDIKEMLAQEIYGLSNWRWYYGDKCERVRWLVELQIRNETFEQDMYNRSSEAARNFTKKYSNMVSVLVSEFGGGQMEYIYSQDGGVVMALTVWSVQRPDNLISMTLWSQFTADMVNISVVNTDEFYDQNRCLDTSFMVDIAMNYCQDELTGSHNSSDRCKVVPDLYICVNNRLQLEQHECNITTVIKQLTGESLIGAQNILPRDTDLDYCRGQRCSAWFIESAAQDQCYQSFSKLVNSSNMDSCRHYQEFLGCIKYHALINGEECPVAELDGMVQIIWRRQGLSMCIGYDEFESQFPDTKHEICNSSLVFHHLIEYVCVQFNYSLLPDPLDRCRSEYYLRGCLLNTLSRDAGCTMNDVERVIIRNEVRQSLLDSIPVEFCASNLTDSQCERDFYVTTSIQGEKCYQNIMMMYYLPLFLNVDDVMSADPARGKLKCSMFTEALRCFQEATDNNRSCSAADLAPALTKSLHITKQFLPTNFFGGNNSSELFVNWTECEANLSVDTAVAGCPSTSVGADIVMSRCAISVLAGAQWFQAEPCLMVDGFYDCMSNIALPVQCPGDYFNVSIEQHSSHIASVLDGFHPIRCKNIQNCSATLNSAAQTEDHPAGTTIDEKCFGPLNSLVYYYQFAYNMTDFEKCTVFETMLSDAGDCLSVHLPDYCDSSIDEIIQQRKSIYNLTGFDVNMCLEFQPDPCYLFNIVGFMKCGHNSYDSSGHYRYCSCFQTAAPAECNLTREEIDMHAKDAAERFTGGMIILDCSEDYHCVDSEYMKAEIMPKCQSDRELFYYNTSCESFDIFVNCVLEEMKNQQLECDPDVVKDRLADDYDRYLNYDEECKRIRWVSELTFNNETFVQEMYIVSSDAYRNFVQRYSFLISTLLRDFGGGLVKYLRQGSVIMALDYWSVGNPDSRIRRSLESQFSEAMGDIQLGFSYQDADQNKCTDSSYVMDVVSRNCSDELAALQSTSDVCKAFAEVYHCVSDKLRMESHDCSLEIVLSHFLFLGQQTNGTTGLLPPGFDIDNCKTEKCSVWFIEQAARGECMAPYARLNSTMTPFTTFNSSDEDRCRHYQEFLGCIKYHALINDEECPVAELDELVQKMWGRPGLSMCIGYDEFESQFPDTKPEICNSSVIVHHLLEYNCLQFNLSVLPDPLDRCRFEYFLRGCVLTSLEKDVGCSMDDVEQVIKREEVRQGLLDSISLDYCAANLRDSQCELDVYSHNNDECFSAPVSLYYLDMFTKVEHLNSSDPNGGKLKCSIFTESLSCLMRSSDANNTCSAIDIAPAVRRSLQITRYLLPESFPGANVSQTNISWTECDDLPDDSLIKSCPPSSVVVDMAVSRCAITVLYASRIFQVDPCMLLDGFKGCLASMVLPETCPENYLQTSLEEYSTYIPSVMDGFDPLKCQYLGNCSQMLYSYTMENQSLSSTIEDRCFGPVNTFVYYFSSQVNFTHYEKCTVFQTLLSDVESCLVKYLPSYCESSIGDIVQQRQQIFMMYGFDMCTEYPPDECSMFGDVVFMRCHQNLVYDDNAGHCRLRKCYHEVTPAECNYTKTDIEYYSNDAYKKYTGYMLPNCTGDEHCFDLDYIETEIFPKCRSELEVFIDDRNCQNFDEFVTCVQEEMEKLEIKCDSDELKTRLAEEYYRYMTSYWDYSENCKHNKDNS